jgi:hypothetical protein
MLKKAGWNLRQCIPIFCASITKHRLVYAFAEKEIMANVSKLIFGAAIAAASIATPALAAHKSKPISAHKLGYQRLRVMPYMAEATRDELIFAFTLPGSTTRHKLGIQRYKGQASRQIGPLFERPA